MKYLLAAVAVVVLSGCASNDQGGLNGGSGREQGGMTESQRESVMKNNVSDNLQHPGVNWDTW